MAIPGLAMGRRFRVNRGEMAEPEQRREPWRASRPHHVWTGRRHVAGRGRTAGHPCPADTELETPGADNLPEVTL